MFGDFLLFEAPGAAPKPARRLSLGDTGGRNEAWLRDTLFAHPEILPVADIDPSYGPLIPLCRELRTQAGPIDIAFINPLGQLTLVECKLWRNAEARRKVVAQVLDYARAISRWSYADLQRQVSAALDEKGDIPFARAKAIDPSIEEHSFIDAVSRSMRSGRFLLLIAGDGIREDLGAMAELINRNAASAFALGLVEVALYDAGGGGLAIQPRVLARTQLIERHLVVLRSEDGAPVAIKALETAEEEAVVPAAPGEGAENPKQAAYRAWWAPVIESRFDDPEQEPATLRWPNNVRVALPWPGVWLTAYRSADRDETLGIFLSGRSEALDSFWSALGAQAGELLGELPDGAQLAEEKGRQVLKTVRAGADFPDEVSKQAWFAGALNAYVNALRPRMKALGSVMPNGGNG